MALFTDSNISSLEDLQAHDSAVLDVAKTEGVSLSSKLGVAESEIGIELETFLLRLRGASWNNLNGSAYQTTQVVVTAALQRWHTLRTLALFYGDVYQSQLNDRYLGKWKQFVEMAKEAADRLFQLGVGIVNNPLPRPAAPQVIAAGGGGPHTVYVIAIAWRNWSGETGICSDTVVFQAPNGELPQVTPAEAPMTAAYYDVFAGPSAGELTRQNTSPIDLVASWTMPTSGLLSGNAPGTGQSADLYLRLNRILQRG